MSESIRIRGGLSLPWISLKVKWNSGIAYRFPNQVTLGTIAGA